MIKRFLVIFVCVVMLIMPLVNSACDSKSTTDIITETDIIAEIKSWVIKTRGLDLKSDITIEFITSDQLREKMIKSFNDDFPPADAITTQEILILMDLMQQGQDIRTILLDLYSEQVAGYYDIVEKKLYVINNEPNLSLSARVTLSHEITHALQDQNFNIKSLRDSAEDDSEHSLAIQCLTEGDATLVESLYVYNVLSSKERDLLFKEYEESGSNKLDTAPKYIKEDLIFPYLKGADFTAELYKKNNSFEAIDEAYNNPPVSTEQILHPEKYLTNEKPITVLMPDFGFVLGNDWQKKDSGTLGERDISYYLETYIDTATAENAANGWGGDSYAYYKNSNNEKVFILNSRWDTSNDSTEFFNTYYNFADKKFSNGKGTHTLNNNIHTWQGSDTSIILTKKGDSIVVIIATGKATADLALTAFQ